MTLHTRRKIFYTLVLLFFVLGAGVVLYAEGWRLDFGTWHFEKVGGIYIRSFPENASIFLNGKSVRNESGFLSPGTLISDLLPRTYTVSLKAPGYEPWQENAPVAPSFVAQFKYAVLVPDAAAAAASGTVRQFSIANGSVVLRAASGTDPYNPSQVITANQNRISIFNTDTATTTILDRATAARYIGPSTAVSPSFIAWTRFNAAKNSSTIVLYSEFSESIADASSSLPGKNVELKFVTDGLLGILQNDGQLYLYDLNAKTFRKLADNVKSFAATDDGVSVAALEYNGLEIFTLSGEQNYYRFNLPDVASAENLIWYHDDEHLFVVYPGRISFLDLSDSGLNNFRTVNAGTSPEYEAGTNILYFISPSGMLMKMEFPN